MQYRQKYLVHPSQQAQTPHSILLNGTSQYADAGTNANLGVGETPGSEASYSIWVNYNTA